ncbi:MAG TPA: squalene synthase HpnC [Acidimicrobiales bacterium]|nr:squalene synthase HpnC [Acidimicrobiales bacterium]
MGAAALQAEPALPRAELPPDYLVLGRASSENFPVASRLLPPALRVDLIALYGWARLVDELGDDYPGDRLGALDEVERQLLWALGEKPPGSEGHAAVAEPPSALHPLVANIADAVRRRGLPVEPLTDLVKANRQDQAVSRYETFPDLVGYCKLSANPVGRMVLAMFGMATEDRLAWSDSICTALQLVEHWQDVSEDAVVGRVYLPQEDLGRFGVTVQELTPPPASYVDRGKRGAPGGASAACRALIAFEAARARRMLTEGTPLVRSLRGRLRFAVAGFVAGGHAALDAIAGVDFDIYADTPRPRLRRFLPHMLSLVALGEDRF